MQGDGSKVVRTWAMTRDPNDLVGTAIGVEGLLGTSLDVQLTIETLDGRKYVVDLRPTQAYYVVPPSPTMRSLAVEVGGAAVRQVLRLPGAGPLLLLRAFSGARCGSLRFGRGLRDGTGTWAVAEDGELDSGLFVSACDDDRGDGVGDCREHPSRKGIAVTCRALAASRSHDAAGVLSGRRRITRSDGADSERTATCVNLLALGTMAGLALVILCTGRRHAAVAIWGQDVLVRLRFWVAYLGGVAACAIGLYRVPRRSLLAAERHRTVGDPAGGDCFGVLVRCPVAPGAILPSACGGLRLTGDGAVARRFLLERPWRFTVRWLSMGFSGLARALAGVGSPGWVAESSLYHGFHAAACCAKVSHSPELSHPLTRVARLSVPGDLTVMCQSDVRET